MSPMQEDHARRPSSTSGPGGGRSSPGAEEEVRRLLADSTDRIGLVKELQAQGRAQRRELQDLQGERSALKLEAHAVKRARKELLQHELPTAQAELLDLKEKIKEEQQNEADLRTHLDREEMRQFRKLPIDDVREEDADCREEKRKLHRMKAGDRARILHEAVLSARQQEVEYQQLSQQRTASADEAERELQQLKKQEHRLRRELDHLREHLAQGIPRSQSSSTVSEGSRKERGEGSAAATVEVAMSAKSRSGTFELPAEEHEGDDDAIFGGLAKARRPQAKAGAGLLSSGKVSKVARAPATPAASTSAPKRSTTNVTKALFLQRRA
eukprot:CAMPEP_0197640762 /NCGR_PEP_ID=MMETSP1338-20131121/14937_1 /TAXON_ID=43686 ORGANISM="Pelagodinium beii, Strain RCC1491" /NCGR_SAMPLE_ID=MMETSP1338 /ASSEMBLY_ACC=CAM_ASM_000754 /LENGTH=326 /DNA_ID=CAMNT_0043213635 /DNA_START=146 /DNA_END=1127 /DNA_ORIENTATION=+